MQKTAKKCTKKWDARAKLLFCLLNLLLFWTFSLPSRRRIVKSPFYPIRSQYSSNLQLADLLQDRFDYLWVVKHATSSFNSFCRKLQNKLHIFVARFTVASDWGFLAFPANRERQEVSWPRPCRWVCCSRFAFVWPDLALAVSDLQQGFLHPKKSQSQVWEEILLLRTLLLIN